MLAGNSDFVVRIRLPPSECCAPSLRLRISAPLPRPLWPSAWSRGFTSNYDDALAAISELPYAKWRDYDFTDTVRFYSLRLKEIGLISSTPDTIIAEGTEWRFLNELKRELKT